MTVGDYLLGLSSSPSGSSALNVVANIKGTYPVWSPFDSFSIDFTQTVLDADLGIITLSADITSEQVLADMSSTDIDASFNTTILEGNLA